jgi:hypothetical protein
MHPTVLTYRKNNKHTGTPDLRTRNKGVPMHCGCTQATFQRVFVPAMRELPMLVFSANWPNTIRNTSLICAIGKLTCSPSADATSCASLLRLIATVISFSCHQNLDCYIGIVAFRNVYNNPDNTSAQHDTLLICTANKTHMYWARRTSRHSPYCRLLSS